MLFRRPFAEVLDWPASHVALIAEYLAHEPAPEERNEYALAQLAAIHVNGNRRKGSSPHPLSDFLLFRNAWKKQEEESIEQFAASFGGVKRADNHR